MAETFDKNTETSTRCFWLSVGSDERYLSFEMVEMVLHLWCGAVFGFIYRNGLNILSEFQINNSSISTGKEMSDEQQGEI